MPGSLLLEAESQPGYHATGRSAAFWSESYGGPLIQPLTSASGPIPRARAASSSRAARSISPTRLERRRWRRCGRHSGDVPLGAAGPGGAGGGDPRAEAGLGSRPGEPTCADIDVAGLHAFYLAARARGRARSSSPTRRCGAPSEAAAAGGSRPGPAASRRDLLVDAAGAWADEVALRCGERAARHPALSPHDRPAARGAARAGRAAPDHRRRRRASISSPRRAGGSG